MDSEKEAKKQHLLATYNVIYICPHCDDFMVPFTRTYRELYRSQTLTIKNFPFKKCTSPSCGVEYFDVQLTKAALRKARRRNYLDGNHKVFEYNEIKNWKET